MHIAHTSHKFQTLDFSWNNFFRVIFVAICSNIQRFCLIWEVFTRKSADINESSPLIFLLSLLLQTSSNFLESTTVSKLYALIHSLNHNANCLHEIQVCLLFLFSNFIFRKWSINIWLWKKYLDTITKKSWCTVWVHLLKFNRQIKQAVSNHLIYK